MRRRCALLFFLILCAGIAIARGDQIILKNGEKYSGRFVRGDDKTVEFRVLGRIESFRIADIDQIIFAEPDLAPPAPNPTPVPVASSDRTQQVISEPTPPSLQPAPVTTTDSYTFPVGTDLTIRTTAAIDTDRNKVGDKFEAVLEDPLIVGNQVVAPRGSEVDGTIAYARQSGKVTGQSELILELTALKINGKSYVIRTSDYRQVTSSRSMQTAKAAGGVAALGAIIGAIAGGGKGAAIGAVSGAAVGTGAVALTKGQSIKVPSETLLEFKLEHDLVIDRQQE
jgi:hypothetical protein